jgi:DNA polymerase III subunit gamma/tau
MISRMSKFVVSARKYRPVSFDTVVGQPAVTQTLKSAIKTGQTAHAYLFCGPRGVGKTTCARIFAKTLNCFHLTGTTEACDTCESCKSFNESRSFNIHELDAASNNSVDDIRNLIDQVRILPQVGKYSIYIIDEVHMLSQSAFNAFLKTLEEPPPHAIFVLATTEKHKIIPTILSRCQIFDFHRIRVEDIVAYLARVARLEDIAFEEEALNVIALKADGAMRDALSIFDQVASFSSRNITYREVLDNLNVLDYDYYFRLTETFLEGSATNALMIFDEILQRGFDGQNFLGGLSSHLRDLLVCRDDATLQLLEVSEALKDRYRKQALSCSDDFLFSSLEICSQCELSFKASRNQRLHIEIALIRLAGKAGEKKKITGNLTPLVLPEINKNGVQVIPPEYHVPRVKETVVRITATREPDLSYNNIPRISIRDAFNSDLLGNRGKENHAPQQQGEHHADQADQADNNNTPIIEESLFDSWNSFAGQIREAKPRMSVTLKSVKPRIKDAHTVIIDLNNRSQLEDFNNNTRQELEGFLQMELKNNQLCIEANLLESDEATQAKLYTNEEKFRYLCQKNPVLVSFRQRLNLELD